MTERKFLYYLMLYLVVSIGIKRVYTKVVCHLGGEFVTQQCNLKTNNLILLTDEKQSCQ